MGDALVLADGERKIVTSQAELMESLVTGHTSGSFGSVGVRPVRGLTLRLGGWSGDQTHVEHGLAPVDSGDLIKTDRRLVFLGKLREVEVELSKLVGWHLEGKYLRAYAKGHTTPLVFSLDLGQAERAVWADPAAAAEADVQGPIDSNPNTGWIQPGFPRRILLDDQERVVDADPLLPFAAAFLDTWPSGRPVDAQDVARGVGISYGRAMAMMPELEALGFTSRPDAEGESAVFDPDGGTIPRETRDAADHDPGTGSAEPER